VRPRMVKSSRKRLESSPEPPSGPSSASLIVVAVAAVVVYANTLANGLVYDDRFQVIENPWIRDVRNVPTILTTGVWEFEGSPSNYYRPMMHLAYLLTYSLVGLKPWGFHAVNIALHALTTVLVLTLVRQLLAGSGLRPEAATPAATLAALLFAVHPIHTEAVAWVAGVTELMFSVCFLASLLLYLRADPATRSRQALAAALFFVALLSKETALVLPGVLIALDASSRTDPTSRVPRLRRYLPFFVTAAAYAALRLAVLPQTAPLRRHADLSSYEILINIFPLFTKYLGMLVLPIGLNAFHVLHPIRSLASPQGAFSLLATALFAASCVVAARRRSPVLAGLALVALPLLPVLYIPVLGENTFAERYLYLPSAGLSILAAFGLTHLAESWPSRRRPISALALLLVVLWGGMTVARNSIWRDDFSLWTRTVSQSPDSGYVNNEAGIVYAERSMLDEAIRHYERAARLSPNSARIWNNLGNALADKGQLDRAVEQYRRAIAINPQFAKAHNNLGNALQRVGAAADAAAHYERALELKPDAVEIRLNLGNFYDAQGRREAAMAQYQEALRLAPVSADVHLHLGIAYGERGDLGRAIAHLETAARLAPSDPVVRKNLSHAYALRDSTPPPPPAAPEDRSKGERARPDR